MVSLLYTNPQLCMKVNGVVGAPFDVRNGVKQGDPLSPLLYIISLQPLLDAVEASLPAMQGFGISIPGALGDATAPCEARVAAYAEACGAPWTRAPTDGGTE